ncbi:class I SAM-dependent methyltransferase [Facklamia sp. 7083-14-GEN3]|uniref:class I SAM-dependent methyltransferase n=1 Tax=Facklamia sp. 7083-14-GEN3 TaxID=2973478 RepID=UPI00215B83E7|nr:class I SAM-dependent methyltransferase [Facklamia sp. 7083-14-GEN3]MCR8969418.1 class I SAM-dependent methyltransferase [Facklamia sp. 7083-14-GEN3]
MSFTDVALVYDRFNNLSAYYQWLDFTLAHAGEGVESVLDMACGTGYFTHLLARNYQEVKGMDLNEAMISQAKKRVGSEIENLIFQQGNMLNLQVEEGKYDLVTCYADSLCFLKNEEELKQALFSMIGCLKVGGRLLFDVWTPYQLSQGFDQFSYQDEDEKGALLWTSFTDANDLSVTHQLTVFDRIGTEADQELYRRYQVDLEEKTYPLAIYKKFLQEAGLQPQQIQVFVNFGERQYDESQDQQTDRWFFVCQKGE